MTVSELIKNLENCNQEAEVRINVGCADYGEIVAIEEHDDYIYVQERPKMINNGTLQQAMIEDKND